MPSCSESFFIKSAQHQPQRIKCSIADHIVLKTPVSIAFLYKKHISSDLIIDSLKEVLKDFPIFGGMLAKEGDDLYIDCNNQGVRLTIAQVKDSLFSNLIDVSKLDTEKFVDLIPPYKSSKQASPVLTIKLNYYSDGMVMGFSWSHVIGDMRTFMEFIKALSNCAQQKDYKWGLSPLDRSSYLGKWIQDKQIYLKLKKECKLKILNFIDTLRMLKQIYSPKQSLLLYFTEEEILALKKAMFEKNGRVLSNNDVLCAYLLDFVVRSTNNPESEFYISLVVNMRPRLKLPSNLLGNYIDLVSVKIEHPREVAKAAAKIHDSLKNYLDEHFQHDEIEGLLQEKGMVKKIDRIIFEKMLPQYKNLTISNWSSFGAYSIDFGVIAPSIVLPVGESPLPWLSCIMDGFDNKGLLVTLVLPSSVAKRLKSMSEEIHQYRPHLTSTYGL